MRLFDRANHLPALIESGGHHNHGGINEPGAVHGHKHVDEFVVQMLEFSYQLARGAMERVLFGASLHQSRVKIDYMAHYGGPQHSDSDINAMRADLGNRDMVSHAAPIWVNLEYFNGVATSDEKYKHHHKLFQTPESVQLHRQHEENKHCGHQSRGEHIPSKQQIEPECRSQKLGEVGGYRRDFGGYPQTEIHWAGKMGPTILRQSLASGDSQFGRKILDENRHDVGPQQHP